MTSHPTILEVENLQKVYDGGQVALKDVSLSVRDGEILALLGPNGAGKTTLISIICGIVRPSGGRVTVGGHDIAADFRAARKMIGLVPQEMVLEPFAQVISTLRLSCGLFGMRPDNAYLDDLLHRLALHDKRKAKTMTLSGGMKRRVLIAKALAHKPRILFLDEPTAGVDVELRKDMWAIVRQLRADGVTVILTTHYIEEAEAMADRIGIISGGQLMLVEEKGSLMDRLGQRQMRLKLETPVSALPPSLDRHNLSIAGNGELVYTYDGAQGPAVGDLLVDLANAGLRLHDVETKRRSLEEIFVDLVQNGDRAR